MVFSIRISTFLKSFQNDVRIFSNYLTRSFGLKTDKEIKGDKSKASNMLLICAFLDLDRLTRQDKIEL